MTSPAVTNAWLAIPVAACALLAACGSLPGGPGEHAPTPEAARTRIAALLPAKLADRAGWADDIQAGFEALELAPTDLHVCAVLAVTEQESGFRADPEVPGLPAIALKEMQERAARLHVPALLLNAALDLNSPDGQTWRQRLGKARTERALSEIYEDFISEVPLGRRLLAGYNPVRTGGPMQVSIAFAEGFAAEHRSSRGYSSALPIRREVFTRRGGMYFGIAHLLAYPADYDAMLYRFADFNAGHYASRNAAFQNALMLASGSRLALDGDLLIEGGNADAASQTERAARGVGTRLRLDQDQIHRDFERGDRADFTRTATYTRVFELAESLGRRDLPRALVPQIVLQSPKITRRLTTDWFARRVDERHQRCLARAATLQP